MEKSRLEEAQEQQREAILQGPSRPTIKHILKQKVVRRLTEARKDRIVSKRRSHLKKEGLVDTIPYEEFVTKGDHISKYAEEHGVSYNEAKIQCTALASHLAFSRDEEIEHQKEMIRKLKEEKERIYKEELEGSNLMSQEELIEEFLKIDQEVD